MNRSDVRREPPFHVQATTHGQVMIFSGFGVVAISADEARQLAHALNETARQAEEERAAFLAWQAKQSEATPAPGADAARRGGVAASPAPREETR